MGVGQDRKEDRSPAMFIHTIHPERAKTISGKLFLVFLLRMDGVNEYQLCTG